MQYGYLNPSIKAQYENSLSDNAKVLLNDINNSYIKNVLPSKREVFEDKYGLPGLWNLMRPDYQNIYRKNHVGKIPSNKELVSIKSIILKDLENLRYSDLSMSSADFDVFMNKKLQEEREISEERVLLDIQSIIVNDFYANSTSLGNLKSSLAECNKSNNQKYSSSCLIKVINNIDYSYLSGRHDNWHYSKAALEIASKYDPKTKKYIQHKYLEHTSEIMLSHSYVIYLSEYVDRIFNDRLCAGTPSGMSFKIYRYFIGDTYLSSNLFKFIFMAICIFFNTKFFKNISIFSIFFKEHKR